MRRLLLAATLLFVAAGLSAASEVSFVSPQEGSQLHGLVLLEVSTTLSAVERVEFRVDGILAGVARRAPFRAVHDFGDSGLARTITADVFTSGLTHAASGSIRTASFTAGEALRIDLVEVPLRISSRRKAVPADLRIVENGVEQKVRSLFEQRPPTHFLFLVDRSSSMEGEKLAAARAAVERALTHLRDGDTASVVFFNHTVSRPMPLAAGGRVDPPVASGGTSLRDALASVDPAQRTIVVAITDGADRNSLRSAGEVEMHVSHANVVTWGIAFERGDGAVLLERLAKRSGGGFTRSDPARVAGALDGWMREINSRHVAVYQSSAKSEGWRAIDVRSRSSAVKVTGQRKGYFAR
jgi:Mg-chelatase subunit ChlD